MKDITTELFEHVPVSRFVDRNGRIWTGAACPVCDKFILRNGSNMPCTHHLNTTPTEIVFYREIA